MKYTLYTMNTMIYIYMVYMVCLSMIFIWFRVCMFFQLFTSSSPIHHPQAHCLDSVVRKQKLMFALHGQHHRTCSSNIAWLQLVSLLVCLSHKTLLKSIANPCEHHPTPSSICRLWRTRQHLVFQSCLQLQRHPWWRLIPSRNSRMELWCGT